MASYGFGTHECEIEIFLDHRPEIVKASLEAELISILHRFEEAEVEALHDLAGRGAGNFSRRLGDRAWGPGTLC